MNIFAYGRSLWAKRARGASTEVAEELETHVQHRADELERGGLARATAERRARIELGAAARYQQECRDEMGAPWIETIAQDIRYSWRSLRRSPSFALAAIATLALGVGANILVFAVWNAAILHPLAVPRAESLFALEHVSTGRAQANGNLSYPDYIDLRDRNRSFESLIAYTITQAGFDEGHGNASSEWVYETSGNYFDALSVRPYLGRFFHGRDERGPGSAPFVVLSYAFWNSRFQNDAGVLGRVVELNRHPFTILGVAPPEFRGTLEFFAPALYLPLVNELESDGAQPLLADRGTHWMFEAMGHLKPGWTRAQAEADVNAVGAVLARGYPVDDGKMKFVLAPPGLYGNYLGSPVREFLEGMLLLTAMTLLAACSNLGSLFAARAADRSHEVALRLALGASPWRSARQMLTEALLVALAGGAAGLGLSLAVLRRLAAWHPAPQFPISVPSSPDARVYAAALLLAVVSGLLFSLVPLRQVLRTNPYQAMKPSAAQRSRRFTPRDGLVALQVAICAVLVTGSLVAVRGLQRSMHAELGTQPSGAMVATTDLGMAGYSLATALPPEKRMVEAAQAIPGASAGLINSLPLTGGGNSADVFRENETDLRTRNAAAYTMIYDISPGYLAAAGTRLVAGRDFTWSDNANAPRVALVNRVFAETVLGGVGTAVSRGFKLRGGERVRVTGVVENGKYRSLNEAPAAAIYLPLAQDPATATDLVVRAPMSGPALAAELRERVHRVDRSLPVYTQTWGEAIGWALLPAQIASIALGVLGVLGILLSLTGVFGVAAYAVSLRMRELGIRMALGAQPRAVLRAALAPAIRVLAVGSAAGLVLGVLAARVLGAIVYQATPRDPLVLGGAVALMAGLGLAATWLPAHRALAADPLRLLREE